MGQDRGHGLDPGERADDESRERRRVDGVDKIALGDRTGRQLLTDGDLIQLRACGATVVGTELEGDADPGPHHRVAHDLPCHLMTQRHDLLDRRHLSRGDHLHRRDGDPVLLGDDVPGQILLDRK